jgi:beta-lactamase regulating signal transducer with metallopeptidase domain/TolA-binding protein
MLVFVKLILPPTLCLPTGIGYWCGPDIWPANKQVTPETPVEVTAQEADAITSRYGMEHLPPIQPSGLESASVAAANQTVPITWQAVVFLIWLVGLLVLSVLLFQRFLFVKSLLAQSDKANGRLDETLQQCYRQVGIRKNIELRLSKNMLSPAACGLFKPVILMPASLLENLSRKKLRAVLIHELAHIKRGDLWVSFIQTILQIAYFYNPLLWLANAVVRGIREKAVDEMVLTKLGDEADSYSTTLIDIAEIAFSRPHFSLRLVGVVESKKALSDRIKHILSRPFPKTAKLGILGLIAIFITAAILLPMSKAASGQPEFSAMDVSLTKVDEQNTKTTNDSTANNFIVALPNNVTVELLGICEHPSKDKQWWRLDGSLLEQRPWEKINGSVSPMRGRKAYEIALKLNYPENQAPGYYIHIDNVGSSSNGGSQQSPTSDLRWEVVELPEKLKTIDIHLAIASGKWQTLATQKSPWQGVYVVSDVVWQSPIAQDNKTILSVTHSFTKDQNRVIAIDKKGNEHTGSSTSGSIDKNTVNTQITFKIKLEDIKEFQIQTCPYEYRTFKNVSLKPNFKTNVQIETEKTASDPEYALKATKAKLIFGQAEEIFQNGRNAADANEKKVKMAEALDLYKQVCRIAPSDTKVSASAMMMVGLCYNHLGEIEESINAFNKSIEIFPHSPAVYYYLGEAYHDLGKTREAAEAFQKCVALCDSNQSGFPCSDAQNALKKLKNQKRVN